jgi:glycogen debranching enzyme
MGPFVEAWLRVHGRSDLALREVHERFVAPLLEVAEQAGGHLPEIADADPPHTPRGCPAQAWSVGELLRLQESVLKPRTRARVGATVSSG